jgi:hypothetical protein
MATIRATDFLEAFAQEWMTLVRDKSDKISRKFLDNKTRTQFMQLSGGFLYQVMQRLCEVHPGLVYKTEYYTVDVLYVGGEDLLGWDNLWYPSKIHVLIEHENREYPEEEMWKLVHFRAPLKVLIFYDWNENEKTTQNRRQWLVNKLQSLQNILQKVNTFFAENPQTEYLFLIGNSEMAGGEIRWRWASNINSFQPTVVPLALRRSG